MSKKPIEQRKRVITGVSFSRDTFEKLDKYCYITHANRSSVVEAAVKKYLETNLEKVMELDL